MKAVEFILGPAYWKTKRLLRRTEYESKDYLNWLMDKAARDIIEYSKREIEYYRLHLANCEMEMDNSLRATIRNLPVLEKSTIRQQNGVALLGKPTWRLVKRTTGGSTGSPTVMYLDRMTTRQKEKAFIFDQWSRIRYRPGDAIYNLRGATPGRGKFIKHDWLFNTFIASSLDLCEETVIEHVKQINRISPKFLLGYPSTIFLLASLMAEKGFTLDYQVTGVLCGSEKLFPYQRKMIGKVFNCRVFGWYGHSEYQVLAGECEYSEKLHIYPQYGYTELIPSGRQDENGKEIYEIIGTGFNNYFMPLIRYRTGDYAVVADNQRCKCGRNYVLLDEVIGREQEFLVDNRDNLISVTAVIYGQHYDAFEHIGEFQIIQEKPGKMRLRVQSVNAKSAEAASEMVLGIRRLIGERMEISYELVGEIEKTPIGKRRTVLQALDISNYISTIS